MAFTPYTLTRATTFVREGDHGPNHSRRLTPQPGEIVQYERTEDDTHVIHTVRTRRDGYNWRNQQRLPKPAKAAPVKAPLPSHGAQAAQHATARAAKHAVTALVDKQIAGADQEETHVRRLSKVADTLGDVFQVNYYIPSALDDEVSNPSRVFRRHGFRLDGSNWVFPVEGLEHPAVREVFAEWDAMVPKEEESGVGGFVTRTKVRYWVIKYTKEQLSQMRELAQSQLADELQKTHRSLLARIESASNDLRAAQDALPDDATERDRDRLESGYNGRLRATIQEACERFEMCLKGAEIFDDTGSLDALFGAVRDAIRARALAVNSLLAGKGVKTVRIPNTIS
jgi:hypothetical protein